MTKTNQFKALAVVAATALALCLLALVAVQPAEAAFPGNNGKIAYHRAFDFWAKNPSLTSPEGKLLDDAAHLTYSPDGSRVAYTDDNDIYIANANGTGTPRNLTRNPLLDWYPSWSHDGTRIVFLRRESDNEFHIWTMNTDGTGQRSLTNTELPSDNPKFEPTGGVGSPDWSAPLPDAGAPDGKIVFTYQGRLWTMLADGSAKDELFYTCPTDNGGVCDNAVGNPEFSPEGDEIAAEYFGDIFVVPSSGGTSRTVLPGPNELDNKYPGSELDPTWSPDSKKIAFEHNDIGGSAQYGIYWAKADGSSAGPTQITGNTGEVDPDWQPVPRCTITGTPGDDTGTNALVGTDPTDTSTGKDVICGLGGNDTINGLGGNDIVLGGDGNDRLVGATGNDTLSGGPGADTVLYPGTAPVVANLTTEFATGVGSDVLLGIENLSGSSADDRLTGNAARNLLSGLGGNDFLDARDGKAGNDKVDGGPGASDTCRKDAGDTALNCP